MAPRGEHRVRIARYLIQGKSVNGRLEGELLYPFPEDSVDKLLPEGVPYSVRGAVLLPPCRPSKIVGIGLNYKDHAAERNKPLPSEPLVFLKPPSALLAGGDPILLPAGVGRVDHEAELAVVIGKE